MPLMSTIEPYGKQQLYTQEFRGLNRTERIADGEFADMRNMSSDRYPVLSPRKRREIFYREDGLYISAMITKETPGSHGRAHLFWATTKNGIAAVYEDGMRLSCLDRLMADGEDIVTAMVSMGAYIIIFPQKVWLNTAAAAPGGYECGGLDNLFRAELSQTDRLKIKPCDREGNIITGAVASMQEPESAAESVTWLDTSGDTVVAKRWSVTQRIWITMEGVYSRLDFPSIGDGFSKGDGVVLGGLVTRCLMTNQIIEAVGPVENGHSNWIVVTGLTSSIGDVTKDELTVERKCPDMDYVVECQNRLWGCYYGKGENDVQLNEIYACALGDFRNWRKYQGVSTDSYTASRGSDGRWTGAISYHGKPIFFKRHSMDVVYPSTSGAHEIASSEVRGLIPSVMTQGCIAIVDDILYWFTGTEVVAYDGTQPVSISDSLGPMDYSGGCACGYRGKLYLAIAGEQSSVAGRGNEILVYDTKRQVWHREDSVIPIAMACDGSSLYMGFSDGIKLEDGDPANTDALEGPVSWMAETGDYGLSSPGRSYTARFLLRLWMAKDSWADLYVQYDSTGVWEHKGHIKCGPWTQTREVPILPRRCDHMRFKLEGKGDCKIIAIARQVEEGSDRLW